MMTIPPTVERSIRAYSSRRLKLCASAMCTFSRRLLHASHWRFPLALAHSEFLGSRAHIPARIQTYRLLTHIIDKGANMVMATKMPYCVAGVFSQVGLLMRMIETTMLAAGVSYYTPQGQRCLPDLYNSSLDR